MNAPPAHGYEFGEFRLDAAKRRLWRRDGSIVPLTPRVFDTLLYLVEHNGVVLDKERLMEAVWPDSIVEENNLTQNVSTLRRVFGEAPGSHRFIVTVPGRGYRFVAEVSACGRGRSDTAASSGGPRGRQSDRAEARPFQRSLLFISAAVLTLLLLGGVIFFFSRSGPPVVSAPAPLQFSDKSIAVLPFANLSPDPENAYFADGVKDEILARLSKVAALKVISRTSTEKYKNAPGESARNRARTRGGAYPRRKRATIGRDRARDGAANQRADRYPSLGRDLRSSTGGHFRVETEVAQLVATALEASLTGPEKRALEAKPTANVEAHQAFLKGRCFGIRGPSKDIGRPSRISMRRWGWTGLCPGLCRVSGRLTFPRERERAMAKRDAGQGPGRPP